MIYNICNTTNSSLIRTMSEKLRLIIKHQDRKLKYIFQRNIFWEMILGFLLQFFLNAKTKSTDN